MKDNDVIQVFYGMALMKFRWGQHLTAETKEVLSIAVYNKAIKWQADKQVVLILLLVLHENSLRSIFGIFSSI